MHTDFWRGQLKKVNLPHEYFNLSEVNTQGLLATLYWTVSRWNILGRRDKYLVKNLGLGLIFILSAHISLEDYERGGLWAGGSCFHCILCANLQLQEFSDLVLCCLFFHFCFSIQRKYAWAGTDISVKW